MGGELELVDEELDLALSIAILMKIVETYLAQGHDALELEGVLYRAPPFLAGILNLRGRDADGVIDVFGRLEILVDLLEVHKTIADAHDPRNADLFRLLAD